MRIHLKLILVPVFLVALSLSIFAWRSVVLWDQAQLHLESDMSFSKMELAVEALRTKLVRAEVITSEVLTDESRAELSSMTVGFVAEVYKESGKWLMKWEGISSLDKTQDMSFIRTVPWSSIKRDQPFWKHQGNNRVVYIKPLPSIEAHFLILAFDRSFFPLFFTNLENKHKIFAFSDFETQPLFQDGNWNWLVNPIASQSHKQGYFQDQKKQRWYYYRFPQAGLVLSSSYAPKWTSANLLMALGVIAALLLIITAVLASSMLGGFSKRVKILAEYVQGALSKKDLEDMKVTSGDEIGNLAVSIMQLKKAGSFNSVSETRGQVREGADLGVPAPGVSAVEPLLKGVVCAVRPPLMSLVGFAKLAEDVKSVDEAEEIFSAMKREAEHIKRFVDRISDQDFSFKGSERVIDLNEALLQCLKGFQEVIERREVTVEKSLGEGVEIYAQEEALKSSLIEILQNALDAAVQSGHPSIIISTGKVANEVIMTVINNGSEVDKTNKFGEPFYSTKGDSNLGMGLTIAMEVFRQQNATAVLKPNPGGGLKVNVTWPEAIASMQEQRVKELVNKDRELSPDAMSGNDDELVQVYKTPSIDELGGKAPIAATALGDIPRFPTDAERLGLMKVGGAAASDNVENEGTKTQTKTERERTNVLDSTNTAMGLDVTIVPEKTSIPVGEATTPKDEPGFSDEDTFFNDNDSRASEFTFEPVTQAEVSREEEPLKLQVKESEEEPLKPEIKDKDSAFAKLLVDEDEVKRSSDELSAGGLKIKIKSPQKRS